MPVQRECGQQVLSPRTKVILLWGRNLERSRIEQCGEGRAAQQFLLRSKDLGVLFVQQITPLAFRRRVKHCEPSALDRIQEVCSLCLFSVMLPFDPRMQVPVNGVFSALSKWEPVPGWIEHVVAHTKTCAGTAWLRCNISSMATPNDLP